MTKKPIWKMPQIVTIDAKDLQAYIHAAARSGGCMERQAISGMSAPLGFPGFGNPQGFGRPGSYDDDPRKRY